MSTSASEHTLDCQYCGNQHPKTVCPLIKAIEYHPNGTVKRIEFKEPLQQQWVTPHVFGNPPGVT